jgi:transposase InsO family protein
LTTRFGRYSYRRIAAMLRADGWRVNHKRVARIWQREGLKVPGKQPKRSRLWLNDGSCIRLRPQHRNHFWAYDFVENRTRDGRKFRMLTVIDELTRECLAIEVKRRLNSQDVLAVLGRLFISRGVPDHTRSDNGGEFAAKAVRSWLAEMGVKTLFIEPGTLGRTDTMNRATGSCATNVSIRSYFTLCVRPRSSSSAGGTSTTRSARTRRSAIGHRRQRPSCRPIRPAQSGSSSRIGLP